MSTPKLGQEKRNQLVRDFDSGEYTKQQLAIKHGVSYSSACLVVRQAQGVQKDKTISEMKSEALARHVEEEIVGAYKSLADLKPFIEELWMRFDALKKGETIHGCATRKEYCERVLDKSYRAVHYMLNGGNPVSNRRPQLSVQSETVSLPDQAAAETVSALSTPAAVSRKLLKAADDPAPINSTPAQAKIKISKHIVYEDEVAADVLNTSSGKRCVTADVDITPPFTKKDFHDWLDSVRDEAATNIEVKNRVNAVDISFIDVSPTDAKALAVFYLGLMKIKEEEVVKA